MFDNVILKLKNAVEKEHLDVVDAFDNAIQAIDEVVLKHDRLVISDAIAGIKPNGTEERTFHNTMFEAQQIMLKTLLEVVDTAGLSKKDHQEIQQILKRLNK